MVNKGVIAVGVSALLYVLLKGQRRPPTSLATNWRSWADQLLAVDSARDGTLFCLEQSPIAGVPPYGFSFMKKTDKRGRARLYSMGEQPCDLDTSQTRFERSEEAGFFDGSYGSQKDPDTGALGDRQGPYQSAEDNRKYRGA